MSAYDTDHDPPAPLVDLTVSSVVNRRRSLSVLLDTGSDITAVPQTLIDIRQLYPIGRLEMEGVAADTRMMLTYAVHLTIGDLSIPRLEVILTGLDFVVVSRDVLNRLYLLLNGPELDFTVRTTPFPSP